jgi:flavin reductase (DIM6/NTAB) family NADH-FMN oxidoreductase RutF
LSSGPQQDRPQAIDAKAFWRAIGQRAVGATVVTARGAAGPAGLLGLSATHLCADPPTMLISIDNRTSALATVREAGHFAINYLPRGAEAVADAFGGKTGAKGAERFAGADWTTLTTGAPVLRTAIGALDCVLEEIIERHGVSICVGRVVDVLAGTADEPLVYFRGAFRA